MNIFLYDMHVTYIGKASLSMRYTSMSDSFKQLDTVGKLRYKEKLGMLGVTTVPYRLQKMFGRPTKCFLRVFSSRHITRAARVNNDSSNSAIEAQNLNNPTPC